MLYLREANNNDKDLLYEWASDPVVRANSFHSEPITYEVHEKWFKSMMADESILQFILMDDEVPVGQIRLNLNNDEAEIGYSVASEYRGQGYGHQMLRLILDLVVQQYPQIKKMLARVKPNNMASKTLFEREGYKMEYASYTLNIDC